MYFTIIYHFHLKSFSYCANLQEYKVKITYVSTVTLRWQILPLICAKNAIHAGVHVGLNEYRILKTCLFLKT
jgi:hypothetical protein